MDDLLIIEVDKLANLLGVSRSEVIRKALIEYIKSNKKNYTSSKELSVKKITLT